MGPQSPNWSDVRFTPLTERVRAARARRLEDGTSELLTDEPLDVGGLVQITGPPGATGPCAVVAEVLGPFVPLEGGGYSTRVRPVAEVALAAAERSTRHQTRLAFLGQILGETAHEIANWATAAGLSLEAARTAAEAGNDDDLMPLLDDAFESVESLGELTHAVRRFVRVGAEHVVSAERLVGDALRVARPYLQAVLVSSDIEPARARGDGAELTQVLVNLLRNAAEASPAGAHIAIRAREVDGWVEIVVRDQGHGIPPEITPSIFEPFFTTRDDGTGLGLHICQEIARSHGGTLQAESGGEGEGAVFTLRLPALHHADAPADTAE